MVHYIGPKDSEIINETLPLNIYRNVGGLK